MNFKGSTGFGAIRAAGVYGIIGIDGMHQTPP